MKKIKVNKKNIFQRSNRYFELFKENWKNYFTIDFFDSCNLLLFILGSGFLVYAVLINDIKITEFITAEILFVTFIAILQYTKETLWLKRVTQKQLNENRKSFYIQLRPFIRLQWSNQSWYREGAKDWHIKIINEGDGIAIDCKISFSHSTKNDYRAIIAAEKAFKSVTETNYTDLGFSDYNDYLNNFSPIQKIYRVTLEYKDIANLTYKQSFVTDSRVNDKFRLLSWTLPEIFKNQDIKMIEMDLNHEKK